MATISDVMKEIKQNLSQAITPKFTVPVLKLPDLQHFRNPLIENIEDNFASAFYERLKKLISDFDASLDQAHEVGVRLVNFGQTVVFHLDGMGYYNPSLISFHGPTEDGNPVELIQHVSQISILLTKLPRKDPSIPKKPIGFASEVSQDESPGE